MVVGEEFVLLNIGERNRLALPSEGYSRSHGDDTRIPFSGMVSVPRLQKPMGASALSLAKSNTGI